jgi:hypothetical protein
LVTVALVSAATGTGNGGISDFSTLTPKFTATTASQWAISF